MSDSPETTAAQPGQPEASPPNEGAEGAAGQGTSAPDLYEQVLGAIPETLRGQVEPTLKEWSSNVNKRFMEAAEYRKQWEPYQELGLTDIQPDQLKELLSFAQLAQNDDQFNEWLLREAEARELLEPEEDPGQGGPEGGQQAELDPFDPESFMSQLKETVQETVSSMLDQRLQPVEERFSSIDESERIEQAGQVVNDTLAELKAEHGKDVSDDEWATIEDRALKLSLPYAEEGLGPEAIKKGFADLQEIVSGAERGLFSKKENQPDPPERGGRPATAAKSVTSFKDTREAALEMARQSQA